MKNFASAFYSIAKLSLTFLLLVSATGLYAQLGTLSVQGVLTKADGTAVDDGTYTLKFALWKDPSSTNVADRVHEESLSVETTGGVYSAILGLSTPFGPSATFAEVYYLGVTFGSSELLPRPRLTAAPYAMGLLGGSNIIAGAGNITVDGVLSDSYGFKSSPTSGMFWAGETNFKHAGATRLLIGSNGSNYFTGATFFNAGTQTTGRVSTNDGFGFQSGGTAFSTGLFFDTKDRATIYTDGTVRFHAWNDGNNYYRTSNLHLFDQGSVQMNNNLQVNGFINCNSFVRSGGTFTFTNDDDSGMYSTQDGVLQFRVNGLRVAEFRSPTGYTNNQSVPSSVYFFGVQKGPDNPQVEWDEVTGQLQVDNSSRRYKRNIQPLMDNFALLLKAEPKLYNRVGYSDDLFEAGYIAEEFDSLGLTRLVHYNSLGEIIGVNYKKISLYLNEIVKVHHADIEKMKAEMTGLNAEINALRAENEKLRAANAALQTNQSEFSAQLNALAKRMQAMETLSGNR